jgi:hypothetical protein
VEIVEEEAAPVLVATVCDCTCLLKDLPAKGALKVQVTGVNAAGAGEPTGVEIPRAQANQAAASAAASSEIGDARSALAVCDFTRTSGPIRSPLLLPSMVGAGIGAPLPFA